MSQGNGSNDGNFVVGDVMATDYGVLLLPQLRSKGSLWLLADSFYAGVEEKHVKNNGMEVIKSCNYLNILLYRIKIDGTPCSRWRRIPIATQSADTEFNRFMKALSGKPLVSEPKQFIDFEVLAQMIHADIHESEYNLIIQFVGRYGVIGNVRKINKVLIHRKDFKSLEWDPRAIKYYPVLGKHSKILKFKP